MQDFYENQRSANEVSRVQLKTQQNKKDSRSTNKREDPVRKKLPAHSKERERTERERRRVNEE